MAQTKKYRAKSLNQPSLPADLYEFVATLAVKNQSTRSSVVRMAIAMAMSDPNFQPAPVARPYPKILNNIAVDESQRAFIDGLTINGNSPVKMEENSAVRAVISYYKAKLEETNV
jgi:hypothetical protein